MHLPIHWLLEWLHCAQPLDLTTIEQGFEQLGIEIESKTSTLSDCANLRVACVTDILKHSEGKDGRIVKVFDGQDAHLVEVASGDCQVGIKVVLAPFGPSDVGEDLGEFRESARAPRASTLCSWSDLHLLPDCSDLIELPAEAALGQSPARWLDEPIWELGLTPNLGHCLSVRGLARELARLWTGQVQLHSIPVRAPQFAEFREEVPLKIEVDPSACSAFGYCIAQGIGTASPIWMRRRLWQCGMRPVNPVVDVTNYVMLELGQPLHAYSLDALAGALRITSARAGQRICALDQRTWTLAEGDLIAVDGRGEIAGLAGIIGGVTAEVGPTSQHFLIEGAHFPQALIQRTSRRLGCTTESAKRFGRGCDPLAIPFALSRAGEMLEVIGIKRMSGPRMCALDPHSPKEVVCRAKTVERLLGAHFSDEELRALLARCDLSPKGKDGAFWCEIPSYRYDLQVEVDLVAEIGRQVGLKALPQRISTWRCAKQPHNPEFMLERELRRRCRQLAFSEISTQSLISAHLLFRETYSEKSMGIAHPLQVQKPKSLDFQFLRTNLLGAFLNVLSKAGSTKPTSLQHFEIAKVYGRDQMGKVCEHAALGLLNAGDLIGESWGESSKRCDFYHLKGKVESLLSQLGIENVALHASNSPVLHPGRQASLCTPRGELGIIGQVHPEVAQACSIHGEVFFCQLFVKALFNQRCATITHRAPSLFPASDRDWTVTVREELPFGQLRDLIPSRDLLFSVELLGIYKSPQLGTGRKNVTLRFRYASEKATLSQNLVDQAHESVIRLLVERLSSNLFGATLIPQASSEKN